MRYDAATKGFMVRKALFSACCALALALVGASAAAHPAGVAVAQQASVSGYAAANVGDLSVAPATLVAQTTTGDTSWYVGHESPYTVSNINQLVGLSSIVNTGKDTFKGKIVQMPAELGTLAFLGTSIEPIGTAAHPFEGTFDGNGWTLQNLTLSAGSSLKDIGLFGYAGNSATIKNVRLAGGTVKVSNKAAGKRIANVGAIAGHLGGKIQDCYSSVSVSVTNDGAVPAKAGTDAQTMTTILGVGGLVGTLGGNMTGCTNAGAITVSSKANISDGVPFIAGWVGGLAGMQGDESNATKAITTSNCKNTGAISFSVSGNGGVDRFGSPLYSKSTMVGGIVGYSMASFKSCRNTAAINTGLVRDGAVTAGYGATNVGGIVGSLRGPAMAEAQSATGVVGTSETDPGYDVWRKSGGKSKPTTLQVSRCANTGAITGLASVAGIAGSTGAFTKIVGCSNTAHIEGTRWNKPCPAGIAGISNGDIAYCYNRGRCFSTTGGGYYASGIVALLTTYNNTTTAENLVMDVPELYGCYVTATVGGSDTGYRTAVLAGENDGFIHDNCFLANLTVDKAADEAVFGDDALHSRLVSEGQNRGTLANNHELSADDMKTSLAGSYLNKPYAQKGDWSLYYAPQPGAFPVLNWQGSTTSSPKALSSVASGAAKVENPAYSAAYAPVPVVSLKTSGAKLYQDADYRVVVDAGATKVGGSYQATVEGINGYTGTLGSTVSYSIAKASIATCTVTAEPAVFNWKKQEPKSVTVRDSAGNVIDPDEYTFRTLANSDGSTKAVNGKFYDYVNCHGASYKYDIEVTAKASSKSFTGSTTQAAFRIDWASIMYSPKNDGRTDIPESAKLGDVTFGGKTWPIAKALDTKGYVKIKYTGSEIKPTFKSVTYLGRTLRDGTGKPYYYHPLDYDYMYVYGNPNPEPGKEQDNQCVNVTGSKETELGCVTVRFTEGGNFDNYTNVFYEITPASMKEDVKVAGIAASYTYTGKAVKPAPTLTYNGMTLAAGTDYTLKYANNKNAGKATLTITGKGNYAGSVTKSFTIAPASLAKAKVTVAKATYTGKALTPKVTVKVGAKTLKKGTDYTLKYANNKKAGKKAKVTVTGKGNYRGTLTKSFTIAKAANPFTVKAKAVSLKASKVKVAKRVLKAKQAFKVTKAKGKLTYQKVSGTKKVTVAKNGKVTVKKGCKAGTYRVKVKVTAAGGTNFKKGSKVVALKVRVSN